MHPTYPMARITGHGITTQHGLAHTAGRAHRTTTTIAPLSMRAMPYPQAATASGHAHSQWQLAQARNGNGCIPLSPLSARPTAHRQPGMRGRI